MNKELHYKCNCGIIKAEELYLITIPYKNDLEVKFMCKPCMIKDGLELNEEPEQGFPTLISVYNGWMLSVIRSGYKNV